MTLFFLLIAILVLNLLIRQAPSMKYTTFGRSLYVPHDAHPLPNGAEIWKGFYQSARPVAGKFYSAFFLCLRVNPN